MIVEIYPYKGRTDRIEHYSDNNMMIQQVETGNEYSDAVDVYPCRYTYIETETPIEDTTEASTSDLLNALKEVGVIDAE